MTKLSQHPFDQSIERAVKKAVKPINEEVKTLVRKVTSLNNQIKRLSQKIQNMPAGGGDRNFRGSASSRIESEIMKKGGKIGLSFSDIKDATGYDDKKIRNILFRLHKLDRIQRARRGKYVVVPKKQ